MNFLLLTDAKYHLHVVDPLDDAQVTKYSERASAIVWDHMKLWERDPPVEPWTPDTAPAVVVAMTLKVLGHLWEHRGDDTAAEPDAGIWDAMDLMLRRFTDPTVA